MFNLIKYELKKIFGVNRTLYLGVTIVGIAAMLFIQMQLTGKLPESDVVGFFMRVSMMVTVIFFFMTLAFPTFKSIYSLFSDINGYTAPLEAHLPYPSWKKIVAKLIADSIFVALGGALAVILVGLFLRLGASYTSTAFNDFRGELLKLFAFGPQMYNSIITLLLYAFSVMVSLIGFFSLIAAGQAAFRNRIKGFRAISTIAGIGSIFLYSYLSDSIDMLLTRKFGPSNFISMDLGSSVSGFTGSFFTPRLMVHFAIYTVIGLIFIFLAGYIQDRYSDLN